jgi:RNA polymerase sigma-70 factor, ECF subfamily
VTENEHRRIFQNWLDEHKGLMFKVVRAYALMPTDRDDLFQEIAIQVWRSVASFRGESAVTTWIYRIAINTAIRWTQKEKRNPVASTDDMQHLLHENSAHADERIEWLYHEIHKLDKVDRSVCLLLLEGYSYKEMAGILGITESNVGVKINRIKKQFILKSKTFENGI